MVHWGQAMAPEGHTGPGGQAESPHPLRASHRAQLGRQATGRRDPPYPTRVEGSGKVESPHSLLSSPKCTGYLISTSCLQAPCLEHQGPPGYSLASRPHCQPHNTLLGSPELRMRIR